MTEVAGVIPFTAWEQAVFFVLLIVFAIFIFGWLAKSRKEDRSFQAEESNKWQVFIGSLDDKWRAFNKEQREENNCAMADVNASLSNLTRTTGDLARSVEEMRSDINAHDQQAKEILALVSKPQPKPRAKKTVANDGQ